jgi:hypothetical protein
MSLARKRGWRQLTRAATVPPTRRRRAAAMQSSSKHLKLADFGHQPISGCTLPGFLAFGAAPVSPRPRTTPQPPSRRTPSSQRSGSKRICTFKECCGIHPCIDRRRTHLTTRDGRTSEAPRGRSLRFAESCIFNMLRATGPGTTPFAGANLLTLDAEIQCESQALHERSGGSKQRSLGAEWSAQ